MNRLEKYTNRRYTICVHLIYIVTDNNKIEFFEIIINDNNFIVFYIATVVVLH